jgi:hypothetical protein
VCLLRASFGRHLLCSDYLEAILVSAVSSRGVLAPFWLSCWLPFGSRFRGYGPPAPATPLIWFARLQMHTVKHTFCLGGFQNSCSFVVPANNTVSEVESICFQFIQLLFRSSDQNEVW